MEKFLFIFILFLGIALLLCSCNPSKSGKKHFNLYPISEDLKLGKKLSAEIQRDPHKFPILPERGNEDLYQYVKGIRDNILESGKVRHRKVFSWDLKIIDDIETLNAFVTPGGHIYLYSGLIAFLDSEDQLAGVLGHEIAHADRRHATSQLSKSTLVGILGDVVSGDENEDAARIVTSLMRLKFSRNHEAEADRYSVEYLCSTEYNAAGAAGFFEKIKSKGTKAPKFLSTHPNPANRVEEIKNQKSELGCSGEKTNASHYKRVKLLVK